MTSLDRAKDLLRQMTLTEKVGQLVLRAGCNLDEQGVPDSVDLMKQIEEGKVGTIIQLPKDMSETADYMQHYALEHSRLKIPLLINSDMIHGLETIFPVPIASACSFDTSLVEKSAKASAEEANACGIRYTNAPMIDISRDPRWGRIVESPGEDSYLAGEMAKAFVRGFQNEDAYVMSTLKHYAGYGACEGGRDYDVCEMCENTMLNTYLYPFEQGVKAGADSVMTGFNIIENIPVSGNKKYLRDILRDKFGFNGLVISDAGSCFEMISYGYAKDLYDCAVKSLVAGVDIDLGSDVYQFELENAIRDGKVSEELLDEAVLRVLVKKFDLGLFDNPFKRLPKETIFSDEHLKVAEELALECPVLLENNGILPIAKTKKIAFVGEFSLSKDLLGCWQYSQHVDDVKTIVSGFVDDGFDVVGVCEDYDINNAKKICEKADVVIFNIGESSESNGEARSHHDLHVRNDAINCFNALKACGKNIVTLVVSGRPLILNEFISSDALVMGWNLGHKMADAIAKLFSGEANFSGKLSATIPACEGQIPVYYAKKKLGRPYVKSNATWRFQARYDDGLTDPAYVFGYGLSYSKFIYGEITLDKETMEKGGQIVASINITNDSDCDGVEVVQLYINDKVSEVVRPEKELKGFKRIFMKAHETKKVDFVITEEKLQYYHFDGKCFADSGEFEVFIGSDSNVENKKLFILR